MNNELLSRFLVALVGIPICVVAIYFGGWIFGSGVAFIAAVGAREFYHLTRKKGIEPFDTAGMVLSAGLVLAAVAWPSFGVFAQIALLATLLFTLFMLGVAIWLRWPGGRPIEAVSSTMLGVFYTGGALAFAILLRHLPDTLDLFPPPRAWDGAKLVIFPIAVTWAGDSLAFFGGRAFGRRKLIPRVSPGKTVAGAVSGLLGSVGVAALYAEFFLSSIRFFSISPLLAAGMGLLLGIVAQVGDLAESVIKREVEVKDSGRLLPGHGGALDRVDAILFTLPVTYLLFMIIGAGL